MKKTTFLLLIIFLASGRNSFAQILFRCGCNPPYNLVFTQTSSSTGTLTWENGNGLECSDFEVFLNDLTAMTSYYYYVTGTSQVFTGLNFSHEYVATVSPVSNVVPPVSCRGVDITFGTVNCNNCHYVSNLTVFPNSSTSITASWTPVGNCLMNVRLTRNSVCGSIAGTIQTTSASYTFNNLTPGTSYTVEVWQAGGSNCVRSTADVNTPWRFFDPAYCTSSGDPSNPLYLFSVGFSETPGGYNAGSSNSYIPSYGYVQNFSTTMNLNKNKTYAPYMTSCEKPHGTITPANIYINLWLDYNNDHVFSSSERVLHARSSMTTQSTSPGCDNCLSWIYNYAGSGPNTGTFTTPNSTLTGVVGRFIISTADVSDACNTNITGQVNDIIVNIQ